MTPAICTPKLKTCPRCHNFLAYPRSAPALGGAHKVLYVCAICLDAYGIERVICSELKR